VVATSLEAGIKDQAAALGFELCGIAAAAPGRRDAAAYVTWLGNGFHGEMAYMARGDRVARTLAPAEALPGAGSVVVVGKNYFTGHLPPAIRDDPSRGLIASYAWAPDYHDLLRPRLQRLAEWIAAHAGRRAGRVYVDTGPLLERDAAARAGLGFTGRNTMLIHPRWGSWLFLGAILVDLPLEPDPPRAGTCGRCARCLIACPTDAFPAPYVLDSRRCISYLTIELKGPIPVALRPALGNRIFGCDICNDVCPYNLRFATQSEDPTLAPRADWVAPALRDLMRLSESEFRHRYADSPVLRTRRRGFLRNVAVAIGNWGADEAVPELRAALTDPEPLIRGHAAWALGRIGSGRARRALAAAVEREADPAVLAELAMALDA
jgi:epoxyqueuosine reductase